MKLLIPLQGPSGPREIAWCDLHRITCPRCKAHMNKDNTRFLAPGGILRCKSKAAAGQGSCSADVYVLPLPQIRLAFVAVVTMETMRVLENFPEEYGREMTARDALVLLGSHLEPQDYSRIGLRPPAPPATTAPRRIAGQR